MKSIRYLWIFVLVVQWATVGIAFSAAGKPGTFAELALYKEADRQKILETGAKKEGKLVYYTSEVMKGSAGPVIEAFQKKYPFIKVDTWRGDDAALAARVIEEYKSGHYNFDVLGGTQVPDMVVQEAGFLHPFFSPNLQYLQEGAVIKTPDGGVMRVAYREHGVGLGFNTKFLTREQVPKSYKDLLNPKWKGKMVLAGSSTGNNWIYAILVAYGDDFVNQLAKQEFIVQNVSARALLDMVISGEYALSPTIFSSQVTNSRQDGAPCDWVPLEPVHVNVGELALPKRPPNPHAALLFLDFRLTKEAGEIYKKTGYSPTRKDVPGASTYKKFYGAASLDEMKKWAKLFDDTFVQKR